MDPYSLCIQLRGNALETLWDLGSQIQEIVEMSLFGLGQSDGSCTDAILWG